MDGARHSTAYGAPHFFTRLRATHRSGGAGLPSPERANPKILGIPESSKYPHKLILADYAVSDDELIRVNGALAHTLVTIRLERLNGPTMQGGTR